MRQKLVLVMVVLMVVVMAACGNSEGISETEGSDGKKQLLLWHYYTGSEDALNSMLDEYNQSQDEVEVVAEYVPFDEMNRQLSVGTAGDTLPDIVISDTVNNASMASMGILSDITSQVEEWGEADQLLEGPLNSAVYQDKYYGLPLTTNSLGLFYNEELLNEAGIEEPPSTWDELEKAAATLTTDDVKGFGLSATRSEESTFQFYPFLYSSGATYEELNSPEAADTFNFMKGLLDEGSMSQDVLNATQDDLTRKFIEGNLAMMINGPWMIDRIAESGEVDFGISQIPKDEEYVSVTGGDNIAVTSNADVDAAWNFLSWLFEPEQNEQFAKDTGYYPTRSDVLNEADYWQNTEHVKQFVPIMENAIPRGPSANWPNVSEAIQIAIQEILTGTKPAEEALEDAATEIEEIEAEE
ncbi:ABC transporter substrate-binding protein [Salimicrobium halophilum]|uniref:Carbohydrate ABC transporter substrate-binding protein, CUT1 family n=1 Tax=Salimicrobium halophilum TaxID=86666 RepID=A0A1G8SCM5_9BACI|nr:ABC transporter substrate-binding protein [Salimicrobium halophilum]SDJ26992.1 carbohydrate ABC transporter substrate-binding protein, CUT1 family [Salimicrobium halophilum]